MNNTEETKIENTEPQQTPVRHDQQETVSGRTGSALSTETVKVGKHAADLLKTRDPVKEERMLRQIPLPDSPVNIEDRVRSVIKLFAQSLGLQLTEQNTPSAIGFNINKQSQLKVLLGVCDLMSDSNYKGSFQVPNEEVITKQIGTIEGREGGILDTMRRNAVQPMTEGFEIGFGQHIGGAYQNIPKSPVLKVDKRSLMIASGYNPADGSDYRDFNEGLSSLSKDLNFLMWTRLKRDPKTGKVLKDKKSGKQEQELVATFSPTLNVNYVLDPETKSLMYYEISLAPVFIDEISSDYGGGKDGYFILIPKDFTEEVERAVGKKRITPLLWTFLWYLRLRFQEIENWNNNPINKNRNKPKPYRETLKYEQLCVELKVPETVYKSKRKRTEDNINKAIEIAKKVGYLIDGELDLFGNYILTYNPYYYPRIKKQITIQETTDSANRKKKLQENQ